MRSPRNPKYASFGGTNGEDLAALKPARLNSAFDGMVHTGYANIDVAEHYSKKNQRNPNKTPINFQEAYYTGTNKALPPYLDLSGHEDGEDDLHLARSALIPKDRGDQADF